MFIWWRSKSENGSVFLFWYIVKTFQKFSECSSVNPEIMSSSEDSPVNGKAFEIHQRQKALDDHIKEIKDGKNNQDKVNKVKKG